MSLIDEVRAAQSLPDPSVARLIRLSAGVSQVRLARELGVHRTTLHRWESGERRPRGKERIQYARLLQSLRTEVAA
ncbi:helix-turn-helix transcriptional regulator [Janibacter terrae]|uniref:helix-turn-helix transcriptional regulator n=1 Tax=Janibacter terrae TaxID=103817 RepID=UPI0031F9F60F